MVNPGADQENTYRSCSFCHWKEAVPYDCVWKLNYLVSTGFQKTTKIIHCYTLTPLDGCHLRHSINDLKDGKLKRDLLINMVSWRIAYLSMMGIYRTFGTVHSKWSVLKKEPSSNYQLIPQMYYSHLICQF